MRGRATVAGLCLAALLGVGVVGACTAAAATPEFKLCTMAEPAHTGKYSQNTCANSSFVPDGGQKFEREGFPFAKAKKLSFRDGTSGERFESIVNPSGRRRSVDTGRRSKASLTANCEESRVAAR